MDKPENPLAFPASADGFGNFLKGTPGMTLRDWFAGRALTGYIAASDFGYMTAQEVAEHCFATADAMLAEREQGK